MAKRSMNAPTALNLWQIVSFRLMFEPREKTMRILWVKAGKLLPVDTGGKIRSFNILRELAANHDVTLLTYYGGNRDEDYERDIQGRFPGAMTIYTAAPDATAFERALDYLRRLPGNAPYAVMKFHSPDVEEW